VQDLEECTTRDYWQRASGRLISVGYDALKEVESRIFTIEKRMQDALRAEFYVVVMETERKDSRYVMTLEKENDEWRISDFGEDGSGQPQNGPKNRPADTRRGL